MTLDRCLARFRLGGKVEAAGQADRRPLPRHRGRLLSRRRRLRPARERAHGAGGRRHACRSMSARRRSGRASRRCSRRSPPTRSTCRWRASTACSTAPPPIVKQGYGSYSSRSIVMGGSAIVQAAGFLKDAIRAAAAKRLQLRAGGHRHRRRQCRRPGPRLGCAVGARRRRHCVRRHLFQQQAHLQLRRARRACRGRSRHRPRRADRLHGGRGRRPHHQSADAARPDRRRDRAGARRRAPGKSRLRRRRPVPGRLACRLPAADRERLPGDPRACAGGESPRRTTRSAPRARARAASSRSAA